MNLFYSAKLTFDADPVEGNHIYSLPFSECPECGIKGAASGFSYPWIEGKSIFDSCTLAKLLTKKIGKTTWSEYLKYSNVLQQCLPSNLPVAPGTKFGPWKGRVRSRYKHLISANFHDLLIDQTVINLFVDNNINLNLMEINLKSSTGHKPNVVEVFVPPVGLSCPSSGITICSICNRGSTKFAACVNASTIPSNAHVFKLRDAPNVVVFSQKFVDVCKNNELSGITFEPVPYEYGPQQKSEKLPAAGTMVKMPGVVFPHWTCCKCEN